MIALDDLRNRLPFYAREVALATLGEPSSKTRVEWRWGRKGSFALAIAGPKADSGVTMKPTRAAIYSP